MIPEVGTPEYYEELAMAKFNVENKDLLESFDEQDPFNPENRVRGFMCRQNGKHYGSLVITAVNGDACCQKVYCTPKLRYPFGVKDNGERVYHWPVFYTTEIYNKYDGTNVFAYSYSNASGERFLSFKVRLFPFLKVSRFGDFLGMWQELLERYPVLKDLPSVREGKIGISFEMYGRRNEHLIEYNVDLDTKVLFMVDQREGDVLPPNDKQVVDLRKDGICDTLKAPLVGHAGASKKLSDLYDKMRADLQSTNKKVDDVIQGEEGFVFYGMSSEGWSMWKCKPEMVENIHWANGAISYNSIVTTVKNAYESSEGEVTKEYILGLLKEEFTDSQIELSLGRIHKAQREVAEWVALREVVLEHGYKGTRGEVMRHLSKFLKKEQMKKAFRVVLNTFGFEEH